MESVNYRCVSKGPQEALCRMGFMQGPTESLSDRKDEITAMKALNESIE